MRLLIDQNLPSRLATLLQSEFPGTKHVRNVGLTKASDEEVWDYARRNDFVLVSKDADFQQRALLYGHPPKVIWLRLGNCSASVAIDRLCSQTSAVHDFMADPSASLLVLS
jgi:predicted nuclease of predicted toxin-antitoxin system